VGLLSNFKWQRRILKLPIYSLRTGILSHLIFLIVSAMLLINVVMVKFAEKDLIEARIRSGRLLIRALEQNMGQLSAHKKTELGNLSSDFQFRGSIIKLLAEGDFVGSTIVDRRGNLILTTGTLAEGGENDNALARDAVETGIGSVNFSGSTWGVIWLGKKEVRISEPLLFAGRTIGGITLSASLAPVYQAVRTSEKVILLYIILDTMILALVGIYLLSRIVVKPIHNILDMAEEYEEGELLPIAEESSRNEIAKLSRSLSHMLKRLDQNKKEMKEHILSLEKANKELQQAQNEIIRSEKLASVGRLAAGIAHEIGNPIGIILGYFDLIRKGEISDKEREDFMDRIESEISRINRIIGQLLDFSRPSGGKQEETHVHDMIQTTVDMIRPQPTVEGVRIDLVLDASSDTIFADPDQLQQVFLNVMMNAADALSGKGPSDEDVFVKTLTIRSHNTDGSIELRFMDNGPGIPEEELSHILDPFYTTKEPGDGTGLGLSVCYRIVEGLGGTISAESSVGEGTTIKINLPLYGKEEGE
jgi:two-component system NtrC family sensor kinase